MKGRVENGNRGAQADVPPARNAFLLGHGILVKDVIKWEAPVMVRDASLNPRKLKTALTKAPIYNEDHLIQAIAVKSMTSRDWKNEVIKETGMSKATFNRLLQNVKEIPGVSFDEETKKYSYQNPEGASLK